jgi:hypothetical protein
VNSGNSHSEILNAIVAVHGPLRIHVELIEDDNETELHSKAKRWEIAKIAGLGRLQTKNGPLLNRSAGGEETNWTADKKWFTSPDAVSKRFSKLEDVPVGWIAGRNTKGKNLPHGKFPVRAGWQAWHNPSTGEIQQLALGYEPPVGFIRGTGKDTIRNKKWFHHPITRACIRCVSGTEPNGFIKGRK